MSITSKGRNGDSHRRPVRPGRNAPVSEKVQLSVLRTIFSKTFLAITATVAGLILLSGGGYLWYTKVYADPEHLFWAMVDNNLSTRGVTKELKEQAQAGSSTKLTQLVWNPDSKVKTVRTLSYTTTNPPTELVLEALSTPTETYQHYVKIDRGDGKDFSGIYSLWLRSDNSDMTNSSISFNDAIFNIALFGNLNKQDREEVVSKLKEAYEVDLPTAEKNTRDGRRTYSYNVTLNLQKYAEAARMYAQKLGLPGAELINPKNFKASDRVEAIFTIDVLSRQLKEILYKQNQIVESYSGYGIATDVELPEHTVSPEQFQKAIDSVNQ